jgi:hypothetical protein
MATLLVMTAKSQVCLFVTDGANLAASTIFSKSALRILLPVSVLTVFLERMAPSADMNHPFTSGLPRGIALQMQLRFYLFSTSHSTA